MGRAVCMAYAQQLRAAAPLGAGALQGRSPLLYSSAPALAETTTWTDRDRPVAASSPHIIQKTCWAKKLLGKTKHHDPLVNQAMELTNRAFSLSSSECEKTDSSYSASSSNVDCPVSQNFQFDLWSAVGGCSSSEDNNSPMDLNSCKQILEKPPMSKNLEVVQKNSLENSFNNDFVQLSNSRYLCEVTNLKCASSVPSSKFNKKDAPFQKNPISSQILTPTAPTDEDKLLDLSTVSSSNRSSRASCDQSLSSSSDMANLSFTSDLSSSKNKRVSHSSSSSITPPPPPERHDSLSIAISEESELRDAPWFQAGIPREIALEILEQEPVGSFMVRESTSKPGCFALSLRVPRDFHQTGIAHYLIMRTNRGYKIKGFTKEFGTLTALITHHSVMPELLPCPLSLFRYSPTLKRNDSEDMLNIDEDANYNLMSDFRKLLADINV